MLLQRTKGLHCWDHNITIGLRNRLAVGPSLSRHPRTVPRPGATKCDGLGKLGKPAHHNSRHVLDHRAALPRDLRLKGLCISHALQLLAL